MKPFTKRLALVMGLLFTALSSFALFQSHDESDLREVDAEPFRQGSVAEFASCIQGSDFTDLRPREFAIAVLLPTESYLPPLFIPVQIVVRASAQEQMSGIGAGTIIARMEHALAGWDFSVVDDPRRAMSAASIDPAVSALVGANSPSPTLTERGIVRMWWPVFRDVTPKARLNCFGKSLRGQIVVSNCRVHSVSDLIVCHALGWFIAAREQLCLDSQVKEGSAI